MTQTWQIPVSPAQRWVLLTLSFDKGQRLQGQQGRVFRRFMRAFHVDRLRDVLAAHDNKYNPAVHAAVAPALVMVTADNLDYALKLMDVARDPIAEMTVGPLFDLLEDAKAGREVVVPEGTLAFDPAGDDWTPRKMLGAADSADPIEIAARRIEATLREAGEIRAAEIVAAGQWDLPPTNGASRGVPERASPPAQ